MSKVEVIIVIIILVILSVIAIPQILKAREKEIAGSEVIEKINEPISEFDKYFPREGRRKKGE